MATLKLTNVKKIYDNNVVAVHNFNLDIKDKEFIVFVGPSGCGKSTTLRMIAGLEEISEGTIEIDDEIVNDLQPKDRDIAMVFQNYALYPHLTVYENMAFPLRLKKNPKVSEDEIFNRVINAADILGITDYLMRKPKNLSGGQRQRVSIGRAMVRDSKVFLMDEPLSNLDAKLRNQMRAEIIELRHKIDSTFIYVTHDQTEAMTLGDRIVIMKDGYIQQVDTPQNVFDKPNNLFVAGFIGSPQMNFFDAKLSKEGEDYYVEVGEVKLLIDDKKRDILKEKDINEKDIILGIRPDHLKVSFEDNENTIKGKIIVNEMMGSEMHLHINVNNKQDIIVIVPTISLTKSQKEALQAGKEIDLEFDSKLIHLFDSETEENIIYKKEC